MEEKKMVKQYFDSTSGKNKKREIIEVEVVIEIL